MNQDLTDVQIVNNSLTTVMGRDNIEFTQVLKSMFVLHYHLPPPIHTSLCSSHPHVTLPSAEWLGGGVSRLHIKIDISKHNITCKVQWYMCFFETYPTKCQTKNAAPSEQFLNPIPKIVQSEVSSMHITHICITLTFLAWHRHFNKKNGGLN